MCEMCAEFIALDADDARAERLQKEQGQDSEFEALVEAEQRGDEPIDYDPDDLRWGEPSRA